MSIFSPVEEFFEGGPKHSTSTASLNQQLNIVKREAQKNGVPYWILWGVYGAETTHGANITTSSTGAKGAFQFEPETAKAYNYPYTNEFTIPIFEKQASAAARYLAALHKSCGGDWNCAIKHYSGGGYDLNHVKQYSEGLQTIETPIGGIVKGSPLAGPAEAVNELTSWTKDLGNLLKFLSSSSGWVRIGKVILGFVLVVLALNQLSKISGGPDVVGGAQSAAGVAASAR